MRSRRCTSAPSSCCRSLNVGVAEFDDVPRPCCIASLSREGGSAPAGHLSSGPKWRISQDAFAIYTLWDIRVFEAIASLSPGFKYRWCEFSWKPVDWEVCSRCTCLFASDCLNLGCGVNELGQWHIAREGALSCAPKKAANKEVLHNPNAPPLQAEIRLWGLQVRTSKLFYLPRLFVVLI